MDELSEQLLEWALEARSDDRISPYALEEIKDFVSKLAQLEAGKKNIGHVHDKCCDNCATTGLLCPIRNNDEFTFPCPHWQPLDTGEVGG